MRIKTICILVSIIIALAAVTAIIAAPNATWDSDGWVIRQTYKNPNPTAGTAVATIPGTITYLLADNPLPQTASANIDLLAGASTITQVWTSTNAIKAGYAIVDINGDGSAIFDASGKLVISVRAPNDGADHTVTFKLKPVGTNWLAKVPLLRNFTAPEIAEG